jgi:phycocyanobilin lyase beta subunit
MDTRTVSRMDPGMENLHDPLAARIRAVREADSSEALLAATRALATSAPDGRAGTEAIRCLVEVLGFNNPGAAVAAVDGLIRLGPAAVEPLLSSLDPRNYGARAWAVRALAGIGDVRGLALLEEALASDVGPSVRRAAACGLGRLRLEALPEAEQERVRERALQGLLAGCADGEWVVRYAVAVGLESLAASMQPQPGQRQALLAALGALADSGREDTPVVRLRAKLAQARLAEDP